MKKITLGLVVGVFIGTMLMFTGCGAEKIDLNEFVTVETQGYDGYGTGKAEFDSGKLEEALMANGVDVSGTLNVIMAVSGAADKLDKLSNGDEIEYKWNIDKTAVKTFKKKYKILLCYKDFSTKVEGLKDPAEFNLGDYLDISVNGVAPKGSLYVKTSLNGFIVEADKKDGLSNGDEVTITVKPQMLDANVEELCAQNQIPVFDGTYKYTVEGLHNYVTSVSEIPSDVFEIMKKKSEEALEEAKEDGCGQCDGLFGNVYRHRNYDSYKLVSVGISDAAGDGLYDLNSVIMVYELSFSVHGDVKTYAYTEFKGVVDSNEGLSEDDFKTYLDTFRTCEINEKSYVGLPSIEEINEHNKKTSMGNAIPDYRFEDIQ
jgi:hypothetical protein